MVDWKKKVAKHCGSSLQPGEEFVAATYAEPPGVVGRAVALGAVGGAVGLALGARASKKKTEEAESLGLMQGIADTIPRAKGVLALTNSRFLIFSHSALSGRPKDLVFELPRQNLAAATYEKGKLLGKIQLTFSDGSAVQFEAAKAGKPQLLAEMLGAAIN